MSGGLFEAFGLNASGLEEGDMFDWKAPTQVALYFCNNEKLQHLSNQLINKMLTLPAGSLIVTLVPLPLQRFKRGCRGAGIGMSFCKPNGSNTAFASCFAIQLLSRWIACESVSLRLKAFASGDRLVPGFIMSSELSCRSHARALGKRGGWKGRKGSSNNACS